MRRLSTILLGAIFASSGLAAIASPRALAADETAARLTLLAPGTSAGTTFQGASADGAHVFVATTAVLDGGPSDPYQKIYDAIAQRFVNPVGSGHVFYQASSSDGRYVLFRADVSLLAEDTDLYPDLYLTDGTTLRLVRIGGLFPFPSCSGKCYYLADDGSAVIAVTSDSLLPADTDSALDVYRWTASTGASTLLSPGIPVPAVFAGASPNFERVFIDVTQDYLSIGVQNYLEEYLAGGLTRVGSGIFKSVSGDRTRVYMTTMEALVPSDTDADWDAYELDSTGYHLLSPATAGWTDLIGVTPDGTRWLLQAQTSLVGADTDLAMDLYLLGTATATTLVSGGTTDASGIRANDDLSAVVYQTRSSLVAEDTDGGDDDLYFWSSSGGTQLVTARGTNWSGTTLKAMDHAGSRLVIETALPLTTGDLDTVTDVFRWTPAGGAVLLSPGGDNGVSFAGSSLDAARVFLKTVTKLLPADTNSALDVYVSDLDVTPPVPTIVGPGATSGTTASFTVGSQGGDVVWFDCQVDAGPWAHCPPGQTTLTNLALGPHTVKVSGFDAAANAPLNPASSTWQVVGPDSIPPTVTAPTRALTASSAISSGRVPVKVAWTGADVGSGIARFELSQSTDGGAWTSVSTILTTTSMSPLESPGHTYRFRVRAIDHATNASLWAYGPTVTLSAFQESSSRVSYVGTWTTGSSIVFFGGAAKRATALGAKASITFTGHSIGVVSRRGPDRGRAEIYVNGVRVATIDLYASVYQNQQIIWVGNWSTSVSRTVAIRVLGTTTRPRIDFDAFVTMT